MWDMFTTVAQNAGTNFEVMIVLIAFFGGLIFYAKGFQVGTVSNLIIYGGIFMWFFEAGLNFTIPLILFMMYIVMMALSLYAVNKVTTKGGVV